MIRRRQALSLPLCLAWQLPAQAQSAVLRVVGSADPPFRIFKADGASGLYYDLLNEATRRLGWTVSYREVPSARAFRLMEQGEADLMMGPLRTPERERFLSYSQITLPVEDKGVYTRPGAAPVQALADLQGRDVVVHRGKRYGSVFDAESRVRKHEVADYRSALEMVALGRADAAVLPERQGDALLRQMALGLIKQAWRLPGETPYAVLALNSPWLARQAELERSFQAMRQDGSWQAILARYR
jgi:polar amino acid transport system substrate-binding protein